MQNGERKRFIVLPEDTNYYRINFANCRIPCDGSKKIPTFTTKLVNNSIIVME